MSEAVGPRVAVLASGAGSNFRALADACLSGRVPARMALLVVNKPGVGALAHARQTGVPAVVVESKGLTREEHEAGVQRALDEARIDVVCLAGYMRLLTPEFTKRWEGKLLNIHPALLPSFAGAHGIADALAYGVRYTGVTTHFVTAEMDAGPIILQAVVPVLPDDTEETLAKRVHAEEHRLYPETLRLFAEGRLAIVGRKVVVR